MARGARASSTCAVSSCACNSGLARCATPACCRIAITALHTSPERSAAAALSADSRRLGNPAVASLRPSASTSIVGDRDSPEGKQAWKAGRARDL